MPIGLYQSLFNCSEFGSILNRFYIVGLTGCAVGNEAHQSRPIVQTILMFQKTRFPTIRYAIFHIVHVSLFIEACIEQPYHSKRLLWMMLNEVPTRAQRQPKVGSQIDFLFIKLSIIGTVDIPLTNLTNIVVLLPAAKSMKDT
jgi:hypothetical protein